MDNLKNGFSSATLLDKTITDWKRQSQKYGELRTCILKPVPKTTGDLKLELSISVEFMINGHPATVKVHAKPFITSTLGQAPKSNNIDTERDRLKHLLKELDEAFYRDVAIEKSKHTPQNDF